jgi:hypothetical protein
MLVLMELLALITNLKNSPINISIDWQPAVSIVGKSGLQPQFGGIGLRYVIQ